MVKYTKFQRKKALNNTIQEIYSESQNSEHFSDIITQKENWDKDVLFLSTVLHENNAFKNSANKKRQYSRP